MSRFTFTSSVGSSTFREWAGLALALLLALIAFAVSASGNHAQSVFADPLPEVTVTFTVDTRPYDGGTDATIATCEVVGAAETDDVSCDFSGATATFDSKDAGVDVSASGSGFILDGPDADNYNLTNGDTATGTGTIEQLDVTVNFTTDTRTYDSDTDATVASCDVVGAIEGDDVTCDDGAATVVFDSKNAGVDVSASGSGFVLDGPDADNYNLTNGDTATGTGTIEQLDVTVNFTTDTRTYDSDTDATVASCDVVGAIEGDDVTCDDGAATVVFDSKNAGVDVAASGSGFALGGDDADNYNLTNGDTATGTGTIEQSAIVDHRGDPDQDLRQQHDFERHADRQRSGRFAPDRQRHRPLAGFPVQERAGWRAP